MFEVIIIGNEDSMQNGIFMENPNENQNKFRLKLNQAKKTTDYLYSN